MLRPGGVVEVWRSAISVLKKCEFPKHGGEERMPLVVVRCLEIKDDQDVGFHACDIDGKGDKLHGRWSG